VVQGTTGPRVYKTFLVSLTVAMVVVASARAENGLASYYPGYYPGVGRADEMTCAHRTRPIGSLVTVSYRGRVIRCRVNDRGPFIKGRVIDISTSAARALGMIDAGVVLVSLQDDEMPSEIIRLIAPP
jgi:rare lipoprotein A